MINPQIIYRLLFGGTQLALRAFANAWQSALKNAATGGGISARSMSVAEAQKVLGLEESKDAGALTPEAVKERADKLFKANQKAESFYLQSKVLTARQVLDAELKKRFSQENK